MNREKYISDISIQAAFIVFLVTFLITFVFNLNKELISFYDTTRKFILVFSIVISLFTIFFGYRKSKILSQKKVKLSEWVYGSIVLSISYTISFVGGVFIVLEILNQAFEDLSLAKYTTSFMVGIFCGASTHWLLNRILRVGVNNVINLIFVIAIGGTFLSMFINQDPHWWKESLSYLGKDASNSNIIFNLTFILTGLILILLSEFLIEDMKFLVKGKKIESSRILGSRIFIYSVAICLAIVGIFPYGRNDFYIMMHNIGAFGAATLFLVVAIFIKSIFKKYSNFFYLYSYTTASLTVLTMILRYTTNYVNVLGSELIVFTLVGIWIILFVKENSFLRYEKIG